MQRVIQSHPGYPPLLRMRLKCFVAEDHLGRAEQSLWHTDCHVYIPGSPQPPSKAERSIHQLRTWALLCSRGPSLSATPGCDPAALGGWATALSLPSHTAGPARTDEILVGKAQGYAVAQEKLIPTFFIPEV